MLNLDKQTKINKIELTIAILQKETFIKIFAFYIK
jgi:hypothetical protein